MLTSPRQASALLTHVRLSVVQLKCRCRINNAIIDRCASIIVAEATSDMLINRTTVFEADRKRFEAVSSRGFSIVELLKMTVTHIREMESMENKRKLFKSEQRDQW